MESTEMISPLSRSASSTAMSDLPTAVGPANRSGRGWRIEEGGGSSGSAAIAILYPSSAILSSFRAWQEPKQNHARCKDGDADQLGRRNPAAKVILRVITAEHFHKRAQDGITHQIDAEDLSVELFAPKQDRKSTRLNSSHL